MTLTAVISGGLILREESRKPLTKGETMEWTPVEVGTGGQVVCLGSSATVPAMPFHVGAKGREMIARQALPADFPSSQLVTPETGDFQKRRRAGDSRPAVYSGGTKPAWTCC